MNGYVAFYKNKRYEVHAETLLKARTKLAIQLNVPRNKEYQINIMLAEKNGQEVIHVAQ